MRKTPKKLVDADTLKEPDRVMYRGTPWLSVEGAQAVLGVHWTRIYMLVRSGSLRGERRGNKTYIRQSDVEKFRKQRDWWNDLHSPKAAVAAR